MSWRIPFQAMILCMVVGGAHGQSDRFVAEPAATGRPARRPVPAPAVRPMWEGERTAMPGVGHNAPRVAVTSRPLAETRKTTVVYPPLPANAETLDADLALLGGAWDATRRSWLRDLYTAAVAAKQRGDMVAHDAAVARYWDVYRAVEARDRALRADAKERERAARRKDLVVPKGQLDR